MRRTRATWLAAALAAVALAAGPACGGARDRAQQGKDKQKDPAAGEPAKPEDKDADKPAPAPSLGGGGGMAAAGLMNALGKAGEPGPFDEPKKSKDAKASAPHHAVVELAGSITELQDLSLFASLGGGGGLQLRELTIRLHAMAADKNVESIILRVGELSLSMAQAEELRATLKAVRAAGKPVRCYTEAASNTTYFVLTACERIALAPTGEIAITGPMVQPLYLKGLLDKLGVQADFLHVGAFKGAAEPLTRTGPSPEMKATYDAILDGIYTRLIDAIAEGRKLERGKAVALVDTALFPEQEALAAGLVDEVAIWETYRDGIVGGSQWMKKPLAKEPAEDLAGLMELVGLQPKPRITAPHVALLYAVGEVVDGKGEGPLSANSEIASRRFSAAIRAVADDDSVKVIVLRVDSPGGSALASELMWHAVQYAKSKKPVIVSMGSLAASGGYYISCGATFIYAQPDTLTGSIGVVGGKIVLGPALAKVGVTAVDLYRGKRAGLMSGLRKWNDDERGAIAGTMQAVYVKFVARVAEGRGKQPADIEPIAQGRVWIGADAKAKGLVDELGGLDDALAMAKQKGGLAADAPVDVYPQEPTLLDLLEGFAGGVSAGPGLSSGLLAGVYADVAALLGPEAARASFGALHTMLRFRDEPVRAIVFLPMVVR